MKSALGSLLVVLLVACGPGLEEESGAEGLGTEVGVQASAVVSSSAGSIPAGLPARLLVGLFEDTGQPWMKDSGVPWDVRYRYLTKGWVNNWGWSSKADGAFALQFMTETSARGYLPALQYYQVNNEPGGGEAQFLSKVQNGTTMKGYFSDYKVLLQRAKEFGKPVLVLLEADGFGLLQQQTKGNPQAYAAVAATGLPELAGLPNTVAGWGLAFLQLRKAVGASNVVLGIHISGWASGKDVAYFSVTDPLQPEVDSVHTFLKPLGLAANATGATYDVLVGDPLDRDSDFYVRVLGQDRWWNASDSASISSKSFNRYAEWLRLWNVTSGKRWVLWQIPEGNSNHLNVPNTRNAPREGYKDNRAEYFFGPDGAAHREHFANSGVIALLFGRGEGQQASHTNDVYTDGQPFLKSRAGAFLKAGGLALPRDPLSSTPPPTSPPPPTGSDNAPFHFESGTQGWTFSGPLVTGLSSSGTRFYAGSRSLAVTMAGPAGGPSRVTVPNPAVGGGRTVSFRVWLPVGHGLSGVQPFVQEGAASGWRWTGAWVAATSLTPGAWNTVTVKVPSGAAAPLSQLGLELFTSASWSGTLHVDSVAW